MEVVIYVLLGFLAILVIVLGYFVFDLRQKLKMFFPNDEGETKSLNDSFKKYLVKLNENTKQIEDFNKRLDGFEKASEDYLQVINFKRFNPFQETGGDQSFLLALMDDTKSGVLITSLHSREGTRIYAKELKKGKSATNLSKEEQDFLNLK
ncbi:DUF4446 family protein [Candidatus Dojkabacteria bacterium]|uniref:DUF4446 family protein n=1 Tax=Candidatus Dojkabacteria bacterium TaxID=2099670 RepID=A0A955L2Y8_9BACT|nr:DUF4446 family protein [Candidatus Dojkabacteria bacterium]